MAMTITVSVLRDAQKFVRRPDEEDGKDRERLTQTVLERVNVNRPFRQMATFFAFDSVLARRPAVRPRTGAK